MKTLIIALVCTLGFIASANAQTGNYYRPTKEDIGKPCVSENGNPNSTYREVTVSETTSTGYQTGSSLSTSGSVKVDGGVVEATAGIQGTDSHNRSSSKTETITYNDIRCVEDKNANLPQQSPAGWY